MKIKTKEIFLRISLLGSIGTCLISPSYGMEDDNQTEKNTIQQNKRVLPKFEVDETIMNENREIVNQLVNQSNDPASIDVELSIIFGWLIHKPIKPNTFDCWGFTEEETPKFANLLLYATHLKELSLKSKNFTSAGLQHILTALYTYPELEILNLGWNPIDDEGGKELLTFVKRKESIKTINLDGTRVNRKIKKSINKIAALRIKPQDINSHTFLDCGFKDEDAPQVANLLSQANNLKWCILSNNKFTTQSLEYILPALHSLPDLEEISFSDNLIDDTGAKALLTFFEKKSSLKSIQLSGNNVNGKVIKLIIRAESLRSASKGL